MRKRLLLGLGLLIGVGVVALLLLPRPRPRINAEMFQKVEKGMTKKELLGLLGPIHNTPYAKGTWWVDKTGQGTIIVLFGPDEKAQETHFIENARIKMPERFPESAFTWLRWW